MENIIITEIGDGFVRLNAKDGYRLYALNLRRFVSDAVIKKNKINNFTAIKK